MCRVYLWMLENQIPPYVGQDDLFGALKVELVYANLIRKFLTYAVE